MERPILFSGPMVRAILEGRKTQTRRVLCCRSGPYKGKTPLDVLPMKAPNEWIGLMELYPNHGQLFRCRFGVPGDRLWVRETFYHIGETGEVFYRATDDSSKGNDLRWPGPWQPSIHMPRKLSRITLEITEIRVQRLQEISEEDAKAEGIATLYSAWELKQIWLRSVDPETMGWKNYLWHGHFNDGDGNKLSDSWPYQYSNYTDARGSYSSLWQLINAAKYPWESNPWVWVIEFKRV